MDEACAKDEAWDVDGIMVVESQGSYRPVVVRLDHMTGRREICDYGSEAAMEAGLSNPRHWAHAVYRATERFCRERQDELQGNEEAR